MTKTIQIRHGLPTKDAPMFPNSIDQALTGVRAAMGTSLDPLDIARIAGILQKYVGGGTTTPLGTTTAAAATGDDLRAHRRAEFSHNRKVAESYKTFWDQKNAEFAASVIR